MTLETRQVQPPNLLHHPIGLNPEFAVQKKTSGLLRGRSVCLDQENPGLLRNNAGNSAAARGLALSEKTPAPVDPKDIAELRCSSALHPTNTITCAQKNPKTSGRSEEARRTPKGVATFSSAPDSEAPDPEAPDCSTIHSITNRSNDTPIQNGQEPPYFDRDGVSRESTQVDFGTLFLRLPEPNRWRFWLAGLFATPEPYASESAGKGNWFSRKAASVSSWCKAHIWYGLLDKVRKRDSHAVRDVLAEKARFETQFRPSGATRLSEGSEFVHASSERPRALDSCLTPVPRGTPYTQHVGSIHRDMLATLDHIEGLHDDDPARLGRRETWLSYFLKGIRRFLRLQPKEANFLEHLLMRSKALDRFHGHGAQASTAQVVGKLERLIGKGAVLSLQSYDASALVAQLAMDQSSLERMAGLREDPNGSAVEEMRNERDNSKIQQLRDKGFASMAEIDHVFRSISYLTHGLSNPKHKLSKILAQSAGIDPGEVASTYSHMIANLKEGQQIKINAGWGHGITLQWIQFCLRTWGFFGATTYVGLDQNFDYSLTFKNENGSIKADWGLQKKTGVIAGVLGWFGYGMGHRNLGFYMGATGGLKFRKQWGFQDSVSLSLGTSSRDTQTTLEHLLSGKVNNPYDVLRMGDEFEVDHFKTKDNGSNFFIMTDGLFSHSANASPGLKARNEGQAFISVPYLSAEVELCKSSSRQGGKFVAKSGTYRPERKAESSNFVTDGAKITVHAGFAAQLRGRLGFDTAEGRHLDLHGPATTGKAGFGLTKQWKGKPLRELLGGSPKPKASKIAEETDSKGDTVGMSWTVTLPRNESALRFPAPRETMKDAISFTTRENREAINEAREALSSALEGFKKKPQRDRVLKELERRSDFLNHEDRKHFRAALLKMVLPFNWRMTPLEKPFRELLNLIDDPTLWRSKSGSDEIFIDMKGSKEDLAAVQKAQLDDNSIKTGGFGQVQAIRRTEERSNTTSADLWVPFYNAKSSSCVTATSQSIWRVDTAAGRAIQ